MNNMWKKLVISCLLAVSVMLLTGGTVFAAAAKPAPDVIGVIDSQFIMSKHPAYEATMQQLQQIAQQKRSEAQTAIEQEPDQAKKAQIYQAKQMELAREEQRLMDPIAKDSQEAVRVIAKQRNVTIVLEKAVVIFGGQDITDYVVQQLSRK